MQLPGRCGELVPGLGDLDPVLVEDVLPVEHAHRAGVLGHPENLFALRDLAPGPVDELVLDGVGAVSRQIEQVTRRGEGRDELELDLHHVRRAGPRLESSAQLGVLGGPLTGVDNLDLDVGVLVFEQLHLFLDAANPGPERQLCWLLQGISQLGVTEGRVAGVSIRLVRGGTGGASGKREDGRRAEGEEAEPAWRGSRCLCCDHA
jgi:hypothetical protein